MGRPVTFQMKLNACVKASDADGAMQLFEQQVFFEKQQQLAAEVSKLDKYAHATLLALLSAQRRPDDCDRVYQSMLDRGIESDERTVTLRVRMLCTSGRHQAAFDCLAEAEAAAGLELKQRTYATLLQGLCEYSEAMRAHSLLARMRDELAMAPGESEYLSMAVLCLGGGGGGDGAELERWLHALQESTAQLSQGSLERLQAALNGSTSYKAVLTSIDEQGVCASCGTVLESLALTTDQAAQLSAGLLSAAAARDAGHSADLLRFAEWAKMRSFRYVIDGANVGYRNQNFDGGGFSFEQVELMRRELCRLDPDHEPLLVLPAHYFDEASVPNHSKANSLNDALCQPVMAADAVIAAKWTALGSLWKSPPGANDDWYWMIATVIAGKDARVLTNDHMRDHSTAMALPPYFHAWKSRHTVSFDFSHATAAGRPEPKLSLIKPPSFSHEIQRTAGGAWHFPGPAAKNWLCARVTAEPNPGGSDAKRRKLENAGAAGSEASVSV